MSNKSSGVFGKIYNKLNWKSNRKSFPRKSQTNGPPGKIRNFQKLEEYHVNKIIQFSQGKNTLKIKVIF